MIRAVMEQARDALQKALPIVQYDAQMMADITRHAPLDPESQAKHDSTEYESERLARQMPEVIAALDAALAEQAQPVATLHDDGCFTWKRDEFRRRYDRQRAGWRMDVYATPPAPVVPPGWHPISEPYEPTDELDIMLGDGSILCAVLPQFDGDLWWGGDGTGEKFIDPKHANVTHWRLHAAAPEAPTSSAPQPLTDFQEGQWWLVELDAAARDGSHDLKRAVAVVRNLLRTAQAQVPQALTDPCAKLLQEALPHAEWQDKHIHPVGRETHQNWKVTVYLPVPLSEADKSPQAALTRAVEAEMLRRMGVQG